MMNHDFYNQLESIAKDNTGTISQVCQGLTWTYCKAYTPLGENLGFAQSPGSATRTLPWPGSLTNKTTDELSGWIRSWNFHEATVGVAALNASVNHSENELIKKSQIIESASAGNLAIFEYFKPQLKNKKIVIIGRYPGIESITEGLDISIIERNPKGNDYPDPASEYLLPQADCVFITGTSIINKTFPRLAELAKNAVSVLMGPTVPWLELFKDYSIDYLAGTLTKNPAVAEQIAQEGGGTRLFDAGVTYAFTNLTGKRL